METVEPPQESIPIEQVKYYNDIGISDHFSLVLLLQTNIVSLRK